MKFDALPVALHLANEALALLVEIAMLAALASWGVMMGSHGVTAIALGVAAPLAAAVVWGLFAAPKARIRLPIAGVLIVKALVFGVAAAALAALGRRGLAMAFTAVAYVNGAIAALDRDAAMRAARRP